MQTAIPESPAAALAAFRQRRRGRTPGWALPVLGLAMVPVGHAVAALTLPGLRQVAEMDVHATGTVLTNVLLGIVTLVCTSAASRLSEDPAVLSELVEGRGLEELLPSSTTPAELVDGVARRCIRNGSAAALSFAPAVLLAAVVADPSRQMATFAGGGIALLLLLVLLPLLAWLSCSTAIWSGDRSGRQLVLMTQVMVPPLLLTAFSIATSSVALVIAGCVLAYAWALAACRRSAIAGLVPPTPPVAASAPHRFRAATSENPILAREAWREGRSARGLLLSTAVMLWAALCLVLLLAPESLAAQLLLLAGASGMFTGWRGVHLVLEEREKRTLTPLASSWSDHGEIVRGYLQAALGSAGRVTGMLASIVGVAGFALSGEPWILAFAVLAALAPHAGAALGVGGAALARNRARVAGALTLPGLLFFMAAVGLPVLYARFGCPQHLPALWVTLVLGTTAANLVWGLRASREGLRNLFGLP